jgi:hypothetical protein
MSFMTKIAIVLLCFSLCGAGTFIASSAHNKTEPPETSVIPVKNRDVAGRFWIEV